MNADDADLIRVIRVHLRLRTEFHALDQLDKSRIVWDRIKDWVDIQEKRVRLERRPVFSAPVNQTRLPRYSADVGKSMCAEI